ncbi:TPA: ABC transporter ATP-binding protein [Candidatus Woesearchaeota archaeon]|nr:ABC transporter ATP-binding protein [Candidatus Woesearchaeota archaeon]
MKFDLEVKGVTKSFVSKGKKFYAVNGVDFKIKKGEIFGLLGPNGAGKTTLMNIIIGMVTPEKGSISILGESNKNRAVFDRINGIAAETHFHWGLKPLDILRFYGRVYGIEREEAEKRIKELVELFEITEFLHSKYTKLSTGERARLAFAKALINKPELLLLDEPTLGLDPNIALKVRKLVKRLNEKEKTTILLTSHYMQEVELLADRVAFINKGKIIDIGKIEKVKVKHFNTYDLWIRPSEIKQKAFLKSMGFEIKGDRIYKEMKTSEDLSTILTQLHKKGLKIDDIKVKRPSLEDYFIKLAK